MAGVILLGGGIDSTALLLHLRKHYPDEKLYGMHFQYGQKADALELEAIAYWCNKLEVQQLVVLPLPLNLIAGSSILRGWAPGGSNRLEGRNVIFTMIAATYAATMLAERVYLGYHREPENAPFPDATVSAASAMQQVLRHAYSCDIEISVPFAEMSRTQILRLGYSLDPEIITHTHTCYEGVKGGCGKCVHCKQRMTMINNMLSDLDEPLEENA